MTQDEIIEMAKEAGFWQDLSIYQGLGEHFKAFAKLVVAKHDPKIAIADAYRAGVDSGIAAEREACARVCEQFQKDYVYTADLAGAVAAIKHRMADAIRARGEA